MKVLSLCILLIINLCLYGVAKLKAPKVEKKAHIMSKHGVKRVDHYYWLKERENPKVIEYLEQENKYTEDSLAHLKDFRESLFEEMKARIKKNIDSVPYQKDGYLYWYRYEEGKEYSIYCRKKLGQNKEEIFLDVNELAKGKKFMSVGDLKVSPNGELLAYCVDIQGRNQFELYLKDLKTGATISTGVKAIAANIAWANDNTTLFYVGKDQETLREDKVYRYQTKAKKSELVFQEKDEAFWVSISRSKSNQYIFIELGSTLSSEVHLIDANKPFEKIKLFQERQDKLEYYIDHGDDEFFILNNGEAQNFKLQTCGEKKTQIKHWKNLIVHRSDVYLENFELFKDYIVLQERSNGQRRFIVREKKSKKSYEIVQDESVFNVTFSHNKVYDTHDFRFNYQSLTTPNSVYRYDLKKNNKTLLKETEVLGSFDKNDYLSERIMATANDGAKVPVSLVYKKGLKKNGKNPTLLYAYGSYGSSMNPYFSSVRLSLLDRGFVFAIAHIRGGADMGRQWYEDGKMMKKKNTFTDFIDCAEELIRLNFTNSKKLYANGGSAGGLLMGAVANMRPELFHGICADVPFVDVITTMLDESIPLTTGEYDEWGNPNVKEHHDYMLSYSPYDNVEAKEYPHMLITTGLHDSQVQYWEPAKWVAKLRELKTDKNQLFLKTDMDSGHGGASGRFESLKEIALMYAFFFNLQNIMK